MEIAYVDRPHLAKVLRIWRHEGGGLRHVTDVPGLTNHRIGWDRIPGGIRDCGRGPEMITADGGWRRVIATTWDGRRAAKRDLGAYAEDVLTELVEGAYDTYERWPGAFTTSLPTAMHAGVSWHRMGGRLILNGGSSMALNTEAGNMSRVPSLHAGVSFSPGRRYSLPLRTGVRVGGGGAMTLGFGFGILTPVYDINIGLAATPRSDLVGGGARYMLAVSVANIRI